MTTTDAFQLNKSYMFAKIRAGLPNERNRTMNLLECKDDLLYAWDSVASCLLVINWRAAQLRSFNDVKFQTLIPATPQIFQVERVLASNEGSLIALAGPRGLSVLELPRRWGQNGQFMEGKEVITCRSKNLDAHFFNNNPHLKLQQIRWHPASPTDSHLLVLLSNNTIRVYDNFHLRHVWQVGPLPSKTEENVNGSTLPTAHDLGETAVDFDIAPAGIAPNSKWFDNSESNNDLSIVGNKYKSKLNSTKPTKIEWPIVIIRENGNIYILSAGIDTESPRLQGPITMKPQTIDNYGLDSCSILVIPSLPPTLVIAESTGKLHHALLVESENCKESFSEVDLNLTLYPAEWTVHVLETVELELGLPKKETLNISHCPIHLKRDFIDELRYFAFHNTGLHVITINFIGEIQRFLETDVVSDLANLTNPSRAEYIVCTKIDSGECVNAVLGFVLLQMPSGIIVLLSSGQVLSLKLVINTKLLSNHDAIKHNLKQHYLNKKESQVDMLLGPSFDQHIQNILKRSVTQPILSLDKSSEPSAQECYELLTQAVEVLRSQYIKKHEQARSDFVKRLNTIKLHKEQQKRDIEILERRRDEIRECAHRLAEKFEETSEQQELLSKKCQYLVRQANICLPINSTSDKEFRQEVEKISKTSNNLNNTLEKYRHVINKQMYHISKYSGNTKNKSLELPEKQETTIKEILSQLTTEIDGLIKEIKLIQNVVTV